MKKWALFNRLWHWSNAFIIFFLIISSQLMETEIGISAIKYHVFLGFAFAFLLLSRILYGILGFDHLNMGRVKKGIGNALNLLRSKKIKEMSEDEKYSVKKGFIKLSYFFLALILLSSALTGLLLRFNQALSLDSFYHFIKSIHETSFVLLALFIIAHIVGVIIAECTKEPNIVSDMINGGKE